MFSLLKRTFLILLGFTLITVFIWYVGPYFGSARITRWNPRPHV